MSRGQQECPSSASQALQSAGSMIWHSRLKASHARSSCPPSHNPSSLHFSARSSSVIGPAWKISRRIRSISSKRLLAMVGALWEEGAGKVKCGARALERCSGTEAKYRGEVSYLVPAVRLAARLRGGA